MTCLRPPRPRREPAKPKEEKDKAEAKEKAYPAPELDGGVAWLNTAGPLTPEGPASGKIVLLDFWTLCCINCIHILPDLAKLEKKYPNELVVIGVHSAKFDNEKDTESIRKAILRYEIEHPVVNDADHEDLATLRRPTPGRRSCLIDPEGNFVGYDLRRGQLTSVLDQRHRQADQGRTRAKKTLNEKPISFELAQFSETATARCSSPARCWPTPRASGCSSPTARTTASSSRTWTARRSPSPAPATPGKTDGAFDKAQFDDPQGMALDGDTLYVADRKNHLIRALDLKAQTVKTVAGTGEQGRDRARRRPGPQDRPEQPVGPAAARRQAATSPWPGTTRSGRSTSTKDDVDPYAGNGREDIARRPAARSRCFAQPSGLATDGKTLYVADSEVSAIRAVPLDGKGEVKTLVGEGLFEFGDVDGVGDKVRLQHALGVAYHDGKLYVADTYNSKIKVLDPAKRDVQDVPGRRAGRLAGRRRCSTSRAASASPATSSTSPTPTPTASASST